MQGGVGLEAMGAVGLEAMGAVQDGKCMAGLLVRGGNGKFL